MNCPSCQSKAKEISAEHIICGTCGDLSRVDGEWVPTEKVPESPKPVEEHPKPKEKEEPPTVEVGKPVSGDDEKWLTRLRLSVGGDGA